MPELTKEALLRSLPQVEEVLGLPALAQTVEELSRPLVADLVRQALGDLRQQILGDAVPSNSGLLRDVGVLQDAGPAAVLDKVVKQVLLSVHKLQAPSLRRVINASGVILHTNLGRSVLPAAAVESVRMMAAAYSTLEYDPVARARGSRHAHYEELACLLTGAEAAMAVNNNAAAVLLVLSEFANGKDAVVSRGELVEIGGSFRVPDIMKLSGAQMVEVGTTNKTHLSDYEKALGPQTALFLKVHPSNYRVVGFTQSVQTRDLRDLADRVNASGPEIVVYEDLGSGALIPMECLGRQAEPTVTESLQNGCDLVSFSGDKLLGGPQAGIIVGKKTCIERLKNNPMARALRLDKLVLAALEATLRIYLDKDRAWQEIPTLRMLAISPEALRERTNRFQRELAGLLPPGSAELAVVDEVARAGGGALPMSDIPSCALQITFLRGNAQECSNYLISKREYPVITRIKNERLLCDLRTVLGDDEELELAHAIQDYYAQLD